jgi:glutamine synthetase
MATYKFEYVWLDGYEPMPHIRSKTAIKELKSFDGKAESLPEWSFDGSSTKQAEGHSSDCILKPVRVYSDPARENGYVVLCEVLNADHSPHSTNARATIEGGELESDFWFGFEQEYVLMTDDGRPIGFPRGGFPEPQGPYYCAVGYHNVAGRDFIEEHMNTCIAADVGIVGINAEVMLGQWEYQIFGVGTKRACDDLVMSRYFLYRIAEKYKFIVELDPKPIKGNWNGSGMHSNFSTTYTRETGGEKYIHALCQGFAPHHAEHMAEYGAHNELRMTGAYETASFENFSFGVSFFNDTATTEIYTIDHGLKGYLEDRRPASNADPYRVTSRILKTYAEAHQKAIA